MPVKFVLTSLVAVTYILYSYVALPKGNTAICVLQRNRSHDLEQVFQVAPLTDGHNDLPIWLRAFYGNRINNLTSTSSLAGQVDLPRLRSGRLRAQFWSGYVLCPSEEYDYSDFVYYETIHDTLQQIDLIHRLHTQFPKDLRFVQSSTELENTFKSSNHLVAGLIGLEGLHQIGNSASILRMYHFLGIRYITLTHDCNNQYADAAIASKPAHGGLSDAGRELVLEMNRIGMMVDLAHVSAATMRDALATSKAPVIFSHSNAYTLYEHPRNVPDDVLEAVRSNGGVVMVTFYPKYLADDAKNATLQRVADHIMYIGELIGFDHVGIGSDFDGMAESATGLEDVSKYPDLLMEVLERGLSPAQLEGIVGNNVLRVLREAETVARHMADKIRPLEDIVRPFFDQPSSH